jgi:hypothetical protein
MRFPLRAFFLVLALSAGLMPPVYLHAQAIRGPVLGFVPGAAGTEVRPLLGVPGASGVGEALPLNVGVRRVQVSPKQDYVIALRNEGKSVVLFDLAASTLAARPLAFPGVADLVSISPGGSAAAVYDAVTHRVHTIAGLPGNPGAVRTFETSPLFGRVTRLTVSDDGFLALVGSEKGDSGQTELSVIGGAGLSWRVPTDDAAVSFVPGRRDLVVADNLTRSVFLVTDLGRSYGRLPLFTPTDETAVFSAAAVSADGARVFVTTQSGAVAILERETGQLAWLSCGCRPTTLAPLKGSSLFRLTEASATEPIIVLEASSPEPRFVLTPPNTAQ